jgi:peptidoglycan hydrolase-like protein with peptidoglycan-binding domain
LSDLVARLSGLGILRAEHVITEAKHAGLPLAVACVLLEKESGGGRNVWGSDPVATGGAYVKGSAVTAENYAAYKAARLAGQAGAQGCGPCQLTYPPFQQQADSAGGCWDPVVNMRVGFSILRDLIAAHGLRGGFRRYNGSGSAAESYADHAMRRLVVWRTRLGTEPSAPSSEPSSGLPSLGLGSRGPHVRALQIFMRRVFPGYASRLLVDAAYGPATAEVIKEFQGRSGLVADGRVGPRTNQKLWGAGYRGA